MRTPSVSRIECFFDCSSPWTYLCFRNLPTLAAKHGQSIEWRPILVGGVFNAVNPSVYASRAQPVPAKHDYMLKNLQDWARLAGLRIQFPPTVFPVNSVRVMRACAALEGDEAMVRLADAAFAAYFTDDRDIGDERVFRELCARAGLDAERMLAAVSRQEIKDRLRANTDELIARGGFGSPTIFLERDDMYFGNDSLALVDAALSAPAAGRTR